jgi:adenine-specific DNA-methyltransferase
MTPHNWWPHEEVGHTDEAKKEMIGLFGHGNLFDTPKPERLLNRIIQIATNPGDLVLDSFAGSGTTGAVAHKMGRRWIMVELGEHCHTHIVPRLRKVIDGEDPGGVTAATDWKGGGGFRYCRLAPSLLREDAFGNLIINPEYRPEMLAEAVCKLMGYRYAPSEQHYWQHGQASERDFLYVTTASLTHEQLRALSEDVGPERTLLVCCKAFRAKAEAFENLTLQKIPQTVLDRCEWDRDDYSLRIANLPPAPEAEDAAPASAAKPARGRKRSAESPTSDLFGPGDEA